MDSLLNICFLSLPYMYSSATETQWNILISMQDFRKKGNLFLQNSHYPEKIVASLELGQELMHTKHVVCKNIFLSVLGMQSLTSSL